MSEISGKSAAIGLREIADQVEDVCSGEVISIELEFSKLADREAALHALKLHDLKKRISIYSFRLINGVSPEAFWQSMGDAKANAQGLAIARINKPFSSVSDDCFYVGTSRDTLKRLTEQLGFGNASTYSLHLAKWATSFAGKFEISVWPFDQDINVPALLPYIEDQLAGELKPMFGRRGNL